jgi:hypothetical protein
MTLHDGRRPVWRRVARHGGFIPSLQRRNYLLVMVAWRLFIFVAFVGLAKVLKEYHQIDESHEKVMPESKLLHTCCVHVAHKSRRSRSGFGLPLTNVPIIICHPFGRGGLLASHWLYMCMQLYRFACSQ